MKFEKLYCKVFPTNFREQFRDLRKTKTKQFKKKGKNKRKNLLCQRKKNVGKFCLLMGMFARVNDIIMEQTHKVHQIKKEKCD